eukprot:CAMPEP_0203875972 /NCGR_PEP_ID=MMETSP0359-20131031/21092_1 /ASSEMBLY_ACC=CAM_ASM_000338 /TAXON_ID=268821 /ORGANISM="Scrippsiella Hangoei, Strain SHTV-5" /LENGTH=253 /DNA_ID=CAMNT_0050794795 /DNA_START=112 /DNA_END=870 /DNA_ORIENTATION=-
MQAATCERQADNVSRRQNAVMLVRKMPETRTSKRRLQRTATGDCAMVTERCNATLDKSAKVNTCKRRLRRTANRDCAAPTERCKATQDEAILNARVCAEQQAAIVPHRLNAVMLARMSSKNKNFARSDGAARQAAIVPRRTNADRHQALRPQCVPASEVAQDTTDKKGVPITSSSAAIAADPHGCSLHHAFFGLLDAAGTDTSSRHHCLPCKLSQERLSSCHVPACEELQALGVQSHPTKEAQAEAPELDRQA